MESKNPSVASTARAALFTMKAFCIASPTGLLAKTPGFCVTTSSASSLLIMSFSTFQLPAMKFGLLRNGSTIAVFLATAARAFSSVGNTLSNSSHRMRTAGLVALSSSSMSKSSTCCGRVIASSPNHATLDSAARSASLARFAFCSSHTMLKLASTSSESTTTVPSAWVKVTLRTAPHSSSSRSNICTLPSAETAKRIASPSSSTSTT
mmetsp:Transcript_23281/g.57778  ORF Transcript_23281/g.57778 Transcript_23281/m.57778 type:complete len:208 (-) Transcript_23281:149-772(-)